MAKQKPIVPQMREMLPSADITQIEKFEARMAELMSEAKDQPTVSEFLAFSKELATAKANVLAGRAAVPAVEETFTEAEWLAKHPKPTETTAEPAPEADALAEEPVSEPEPPQPPPQGMQPTPKKQPFKRPKRGK